MQVSNENQTEENAEKIEKVRSHKSLSGHVIQILNSDWLIQSIFQSDSEMKEGTGETIEGAAGGEKPKTKTKTIQTPLSITSAKEGFSEKELHAAMERENSMVGKTYSTQS